MSEFRFSLILSVFAHVTVIYVAATGIPYLQRDLPTPERPVAVDLLTIEEITRTKEPEPAPEPEPEPEEEVQQAQAEPVRNRPEPKTETPIPNPDLKPKPKPDQDEVERKKLAQTVTPQTKPRPPTTFDANKIAALIDKSKKDKPPENTREKDLEDAVNKSRVSGLQAARNTASIQEFIRAKMIECWTAPSGAMNFGELRVVIRIRLNPEGYLLGTPEIQNKTQIFSSNNPYYQAAAEGALRAVRLCEPYELPVDLYDTWKEMDFNFDPSDMVG